MIRNIRHKGLLRFFADSDSRGINAKHAARIERILDRLDAATKPAPRAVKSSRAEIDQAILAALKSGNWMDTASLTRITKAPNTTVVSAQLGRMRSKGLVESKPNTFSKLGKVTLLWRRVQE